MMEAEDVRRTMITAALADYKNDLRGMSKEEAQLELSITTDELNELESWVEALTAYLENGCCVS